jgi:hypothetical protein
VVIIFFQRRICSSFNDLLFYKMNMRMCSNWKQHCAEKWHVCCSMQKNNKNLCCLWANYLSFIPHSFLLIHSIDYFVFNYFSLLTSADLLAACPVHLLARNAPSRLPDSVAETFMANSASKTLHIRAMFVKLHGYTFCFFLFLDIYMESFVT